MNLNAMARVGWGGEVMERERKREKYKINRRLEAYIFFLPRRNKT